MSISRAAHTATALRDGRVLVAGGFTEKGSAEGAEVYDSEADRFSSMLPMLTTRHSHTATLLLDGKVLIAGGYGEGTTPLATAEVTAGRRASARSRSGHGRISAGTDLRPP